MKRKFHHSRIYFIKL